MIRLLVPVRVHLTFFVLDISCFWFSFENGSFTSKASASFRLSKLFFSRPIHPLYLPSLVTHLSLFHLVANLHYSPHILGSEHTHRIFSAFSHPHRLIIMVPWSHLRIASLSIYAMSPSCLLLLSSRLVTTSFHHPPRLSLVALPHPLPYHPRIPLPLLIYPCIRTLYPSSFPPFSPPIPSAHFHAQNVSFGSVRARILSYLVSSVVVGACGWCTCSLTICAMS